MNSNVQYAPRQLIKKVIVMSILNDRKIQKCQNSKKILNVAIMK